MDLTCLLQIAERIPGKIGTEVVHWEETQQEDVEFHRWLPILTFRVRHDPKQNTNPIGNVQFNFILSPLCIILEFVALLNIES